MIEEKNLTKLYYSIGEVAQMFEVNTSLIRYWEKEFPSIQPKKNKKGNRLFSPKNIMEIQRIHLLVKQEGHTLEGAKKALKRSELTTQELIQKLTAIKQKLIALK